MERYHIRVDRLGDRTLEFIKSWILKHSIKTYLISEERGTVTSKIHYQGFVDIDMSIRNEKAWRQNLKEHIHTTGRNQYSLSLKHGNLETYICKEGKIVLQSDDIHPLQIEQWKEDSYIKNSYSKGPSFTQKYLDAMSVLPSKEERYLTRETIKYFVNNTKVFDKFVIKRFVYLAYATFHEDRIERMVDYFLDL